MKGEIRWWYLSPLYFLPEQAKVSLLGNSVLLGVGRVVPGQPWQEMVWVLSLPLYNLCFMHGRLEGSQGSPSEIIGLHKENSQFSFLAGLSFFY